MNSLSECLQEMLITCYARWHCYNAYIIWHNASRSGKLKKYRSFIYYMKSLKKLRISLCNRADECFSENLFYDTTISITTSIRYGHQKLFSFNVTIEEEYLTKIWPHTGMHDPIQDNEFNDSIYYQAEYQGTGELFKKFHYTCFSEEK